MKCNECQRLFEERIGGTLSAARTKEFERHLKGCASCRSEFQLMSRLHGSHGREDVAPPDGFQEALQRRIDEYRTLGFGKMEVTLPGVRFDAADDISFLRYTRYYALKNYYRKKVFRVLGEYFPNRAADSLLTAVALYREELERTRGRRVSFRTALESWRQERFAEWREVWKKEPEDVDNRLIVRLWRKLSSVGRRRRLAAVFAGVLGAFLFAVLLRLFVVPGPEKLVIAHHFRGSRRKLFLSHMRRMGERIGVAVEFRQFPPEAIVFLYHHSGGAFIRRARPHLLIMDINILEILRTSVPFHDQRTRAGDVLSPAFRSIRPLAVAREPESGRHRRDPADFSCFAAALTQGEGRFPDAALAGRRFVRYLQLVGKGGRQANGLSVLFGAACLTELSGRRMDFFNELIRSGQGLLRLPGFRAWRKGRAVLYDPAGYYRWRLAFPEYRIYSLLKIDRNPLASFRVLLNGAPRFRKRRAGWRISTGRVSSGIQ